MEEFKLIQKARREGLRKIRKIRQAILIQLDNENVAEATEMLKFQDSPKSQPRCSPLDMCSGCRLLMERGRCNRCVGCCTIRECVEEKRRCTFWPFISKPITYGTSISQASSVFPTIPDYIEKMEAAFVTFEEATERQEDAFETMFEDEDRVKVVKEPCGARTG